MTTDRHGVPRTVAFDRRARRVIAVLDGWRVDEGWWRTPLSRRYVRVMLADGACLTLCQDLLTGQWYRQPDSAA